MAMFCPQATEVMARKLDRESLRPMQKESYLCMAKCCDTAPGPAELQEWCVPRHAVPRQLRVGGAFAGVPKILCTGHKKLDRYKL